MQPPQAYSSDLERQVGASSAQNAAAPSQGRPDLAHSPAPIPSTSLTTQTLIAHPPLLQLPFRPFHAPTLATLQPLGLTMGASHPDLFQSINLTAVGPIPAPLPLPIHHAKAPSLPSLTHRSTDSECFHSAITGPADLLFDPKPGAEYPREYTNSAQSSPGHSEHNQLLSNFTPPAPDPILPLRTGTGQPEASWRPFTSPEPSRSQADVIVSPLLQSSPQHFPKGVDEAPWLTDQAGYEDSIPAPHVEQSVHQQPAHLHRLALSHQKPDQVFFRLYAAVMGVFTVMGLYLCLTTTHTHHGPNKHQSRFFHQAQALLELTAVFSILTTATGIVWLAFLQFYVEKLVWVTVIAVPVLSLGSSTWLLTLALQSTALNRSTAVQLCYYLSFALTLAGSLLQLYYMIRNRRHLRQSMEAIK
ncbi:hypothetical protein H4R34_005229, partial [Dimargaris verticillata]